MNGAGASPRSRVSIALARPDSGRASIARRIQRQLRPGKGANRHDIAHGGIDGGDRPRLGWPEHGRPAEDGCWCASRRLRRSRTTSRRFGYPRAVDHDRTQSEHEAFRALLAEGGAEVVIAGPDEAGLLDAIFAYDPSLMTDAGAVLLRPGKS